MTATIQVTNSFNKILKKQPQLKKPFEKALAKILSAPRQYLEKKLLGQIYSTKIPGIGQGTAQRALFTDQEGALLPFAIASHDEYAKIMDELEQGTINPLQEKTVELKLKTIKEFGKTTPKNALAARSLKAP